MGVRFNSGPIIPGGTLLVKNERSFYSVVMPKVSDEHRAARREQILDAAMARFSVNGFQATGMADVIATAGLSAGAVYRYFKSKDELVEAIVERVLVPFTARFDEVLANEPDPDLADAVRLGVETIDGLTRTGPVNVGRVAVQAFAESLRNERVQRVVTDTYVIICGYFVEAARRAQEAGSLPDDSDPEQVGSALYSLMVGFLLQRVVLGPVESESYTVAVRQLLGTRTAIA